VKTIFPFLIICFLRQAGIGQVEFKNSNLGRIMEFVDPNGHSLLKNYSPDVSGSPFYNPFWAMTNITLLSGKVVGPFPVRLNIVDNGLYFQDSSGAEMVSNPNLAKRAECIDACGKDGVRIVFNNSYPTIDEQNENFYYLVLAEGKIELLRKVYKYVRIEKNELSGEVSKTFVEGNRLYVYSNNKMQQLQYNKRFVLELMKDKERMVELYIETNKISLKKTSDLAKLFSYYNKDL